MKVLQLSQEISQTLGGSVVSNQNLYTSHC